MLDESMFEDIHEIAENSAYLKAVEEKELSREMYDELPSSYDDPRCQEIESKLTADGKLTFDEIFNEPIGFYMIKCFLIADYCVDKAIFIKDVRAYKSMRFESARRKVAALLYNRFVSTDENAILDFEPGSSVFDIIRQKGGGEEKKSVGMGTNGVGGSVNGVGMSGMGGMGPQMDKSDVKSDLKSDAKEKPIVSSNVPSHSTVTTNQINAQMGSGANLSHSGAISSSTSPLIGGSTANGSANGVPSLFQTGTANNSIGVYGKSIRLIQEKVSSGQAPKDLFDEVYQQVLMDLKLDAFPRFRKSEFYRRYIRTKWIETKPVTVKDFTTFRVLGRGGFGAVHACRKRNSGAIYAMKAINKKLVKVKSALDNVLEERNVLVLMKSDFVTNIKYALQDEETLYLVMDLMLGGDLKFHLINAGRFTEKRAKFYAAQVLLGLEHVHKLGIIYRDMKLENVLLDHAGNSKISDLGLAVVTKVKIKGYAGTPGYCFPSADHQLLTSEGFMYLDDVLAHFTSHPTLNVACYVDGRLEYHPITADKVTVEEDDVDLIEFKKYDDDDEISLEATAPHRMYGRLGAVTSPHVGTHWVGGSPPPKVIHSARDVFMAGQHNKNAVFQMTATFSNGYCGDGIPLPFTESLGIHTEDQLNAFLFLYGMWLSNGRVEDSSITVGPAKGAAIAELGNVFARLPLTNDDYHITDDTTNGTERLYHLTSPSWVKYFREQNGQMADQSKQYSQFVWRLHPDGLRSVLSGQRLGCGSDTNTISTPSIRYRDDILRACIQAGYTSTFRLDKQSTHLDGLPQWSVTFTTHPHQAEPNFVVHTNCSMRRGVKARVWCVSVPSKDNLIMFRRVLERDNGTVLRASRPLIVGNTAPEMIKNKLYGPAADIFSYGVMLYRMLCGSKPFKGKIDRDLDKAVIEKKPQFPKEIFSKDATSLLTSLLQKRPELRLGCGEKGIDDIKEHPFFETIDWGLLEAGYIDPPFVPNKFDVNAASLKDIGDFDRAKYKHVKLDDRFKQRIKNFEYVSSQALQDEMVQVLLKVDENVKFEKFAPKAPVSKEQTPQTNNPCCVVL